MVAQNLVLACVANQLIWSVSDIFSYQQQLKSYVFFQFYFTCAQHILSSCLMQAPCTYWLSQNSPQICIATVWVYICGIPKQIQYRFAVNFVTLYCISVLQFKFRKNSIRTRFFFFKSDLNREKWYIFNFKYLIFL